MRSAFLRFPKGLLEVEIATTPTEIGKGLMHRTFLPRGHGMLFVMPTRQVHAFWMHNVLFPLDMVFLDTDGTIISVIDHIPPLNDVRYGPTRPSSYVVEMNAGEAALLGAEPALPGRPQGHQIDVVTPLLLR
jgi:uncharacterized protein